MQKIYVDSRSRVSGSNEDFEIALPYSIAIPEESAMIVDQVVIPNSFYTIEKGVNDNIYVQEQNFSSGTVWRRAVIPPGYYDVISLSGGIETAMNTDRTLFSPYTCAYDAHLGRYVITNPYTTVDEFVAIWSRQSLLTIDYGWPDMDPNDLRDACKQIGMVTGNSVASGTFYDKAPMIMNAPPSLQPHINLFLKSDSIGMPATNLGPNNSMTILSKVVMQAPQLSLNFDAFATMWDQVRIAPQTISSFKITLCGFDGKVVDLQNQPWSFSMTIFPRE